MVKPATQTILDALNGIATSIANLNTKVKSFVPSTYDICPMLDLQNTTVLFEDQIDAFIKLCSATPRLDLFESGNFTDPLTKLSSAGLALLISMGNAHTAFSTALLGRFSINSLIKGHLMKIKVLFDGMLGALTNLLDPIATGVLNAARVQVNAAFDAQINLTYLLDIGIYVPIRLPPLHSSKS